MKTCARCGKSKPASEFHRNKRKQDGLHPVCKACRREYAHAHYEANREAILERNRAWREANAEADREYNRARREANRETEAERSRAYYEANREAIAERQRAHREANREAIREANRAYRAANPESGREARRAWAKANRKARRESARAHRLANLEYYAAASARHRQRVEVNMTREDRELSVAYRKAIANDPCCYCGEYAEVMHIDHMMPIALGGTDHWWNLARACGPCNLHKHTKTAEEFRKEVSMNRPNTHEPFRDL